MVDLNTPAVAELFLELLSTDDLTAIVDKASALLGNPIVLLDASYRIIAHSSSEVPDEAWNKGVQSRAWNYDVVARVNKLLHISGRGTLQQPLILEDFGSHRRRVAGLYAGTVFVGYYVTLEVSNILEDIDEPTYAFTAKVLAKALAINQAVSLQANPGNVTLFLQDLLLGRFADRMLFKERLKGCPLASRTEFQAIALSLAGYMPGNLREDRLQKGIQAAFPSAWSAPEGNYIIIVLDYKELKKQQGNPFEEFISFLRENNLTAGKSMPFSDLFLLPEYRDRAVRALKLAQDLEGSQLYPVRKLLVSYEDYTLIDMVSRLPGESLIYYCNNEVYAIYAHDKKHGTEYMQTLFQYIHAGKSMHKAAESLFVHHNTVNYRIKKIREIFQIDFSDELKNIQYYLSCIILIFYSRLPIDAPVQPEEGRS